MVHTLVKGMGRNEQINIKSHFSIAHVLLCSMVMSYSTCLGILCVCVCVCVCVEQSPASTDVMPKVQRLCVHACQEDF